MASPNSQRVQVFGLGLPPAGTLEGRLRYRVKWRVDGRNRATTSPGGLAASAETMDLVNFYGWRCFVRLARFASDEALRWRDPPPKSRWASLVVMSTRVPRSAGCSFQVIVMVPVNDGSPDSG